MKTLIKEQIIEVLKSHLRFVDHRFHNMIGEDQFEAIASELSDSEPKVRTAEEILKDNMNEHLWTFICTYPVAYKSDTMLSDWIIGAMQEFASQQKKPTDQDIEKHFPIEGSVIMERDMSYDDVCNANKYRREGAKAMRDNEIPITDK